MSVRFLKKKSALVLVFVILFFVSIAATVVYILSSHKQVFIVLIPESDTSEYSIFFGCQDGQPSIPGGSYEVVVVDDGPVLQVSNELQKDDHLVFYLVPDRFRNDIGENLSNCILVNKYVRVFNRAKLNDEECEAMVSFSFDRELLSGEFARKEKSKRRLGS